MSEPTLKEKTAKGLYWISISSGLQQLLSVVAGIIFARILNQDDYGIIGMLSIFVGLVLTIQESGFFTGLINRKEIKHEDYNAVFWFSAATGLTLYLILFFCAPFIAGFFHEPVLTNLSRVLFLYMLAGSMSIAQNAFLVKQLKFKEIAIVNFCSLLISCLIGIALVWRGFTYWGLVIQMVAHGVSTSVLRWYYCSWKPCFTFNIQALKEM
ncbi:MAG: oligosaccharide flippase family protein, partial [Dysgonamonadaceae bacterium]|nr:oligosaccharide flippase family protein [Dysgonamonadaceae bacterium]